MVGYRAFIFRDLRCCGELVSVGVRNSIHLTRSHAGAFLVRFGAPERHLDSLFRKLDILHRQRDQLRAAETSGEPN